jgi:hypothetical protein
MTSTQSPDLGPGAVLIRHRHRERSEAIQGPPPAPFEFWIASSLRPSQ